MPCTAELRAQFSKALRKNVGKNSFSDGAPLDHKTCPPTFIHVAPTDMVDFKPVGKLLCAYCGSGNLSAEYGHTPYGLGSYMECNDCRMILDFTLDTGN